MFRVIIYLESEPHSSLKPLWGRVCVVLVLFHTSYVRRSKINNVGFV